jgi:hypothetical protein
MQQQRNTSELHAAVAVKPMWQPARLALLYFQQALERLESSRVSACCTTAKQ